MKFRISTASERLVGRLDAGEDLVDVLTALCEKHGVTAGEIRAVGHFDSIELVHFDARTKSYETLVDGEGSFDLVSLDGNISTLGGEVALRLAAVFNVAGPVGPQMVGGQLRRARARSAEFVISSFLDLEMERRLEGESGRLVLDKIERKKGVAAPSPSPTAASAEMPDTDDSSEDDSPSLSWDEAIATAEDVEKKRKTARRPGGGGVSTAKKKKSDPYQNLDLDEPLIDKGDLLDHPKLGRCRVLNVEDDQYVRIRLPRGRIRKLALEVLEIEYQGEENGKHLFEARVRR